MQEDLQNENPEVKDPIIGDFKPKRKFLNFVSAANGARVRFIRDVAFLKGDKLSGMLDGVIFKITICDDDTINFEEQEGTNLSDKSMIQRLINEIDEMEVTGYAQKFVINGLEFNDVKGDRCYLEVEHKKPIDKLKSLFEEEKPELSAKGSSFLDDLFGSDADEEVEEFDEDHALDLVLNSMLDDLSEDDLKSIIEDSKNIPEQKPESYIEEKFRKMNDEKINELEFRIEDTQKEIIRYANDIKQSESKLKEKNESLGILETRLETMKPCNELNGYVFFVSEELKDIGELSETETNIANKIADIMKLKKDVLMKMLKDGYYKIKIAKKEDINNQDFELEKNIYNDILSIDLLGKFSITDGGFEYRGELNWHKLVQKMIRNGFEQEPEFDKLCQSNSYDSKEEGESDSEVEIENK